MFDGAAKTSIYKLSKEQRERKERNMQKPKRNLDTPGLKVENASKLP